MTRPFTHEQILAMSDEERQAHAREGISELLRRYLTEALQQGKAYPAYALTNPTSLQQLVDVLAPMVIKLATEMGDGLFERKMAAMEKILSDAAERSA